MGITALVQGVRPFSVKISGHVCVASHLILLFTETARYLVLIWPSLWRREAFLSQNIRTCMCSFTYNPAFHRHSKVFSYNLARPLIYCWPTHLGKLLIRFKPPYTKQWKCALKTLQPIGAQSVLVFDFWKVPFGKRYCFMNLVQQNGIAYLFGSPTHCNILSNCFILFFFNIHNNL